MFVKSKIFVVFFTFLISSVYNSNSNFNINQNNKSYSIVFVYLGDNLPDYLEYSVFQARIFNKNCNIFFVINASAVKKNEQLLNKLKNYQVTVVKCEDLIKSDWHKEFDSTYAQRGISGYWRVTTERFFYIDELMRQYNLKDVFQVECDVMIYVTLENYLDLLHNFYSNCIACPFENDYVASVSFVYFSTSEAIQKFVKFISWIQRGQILEVDMHLLASYKNYTSDKEVDHLPTISKEITRSIILRNQWGEIASKPWKYWNYIEYWDSIFDNDGIGSFLEDGRWSFDRSFFDSTYYKINWEKDSEGRMVPYLCRCELMYRLNTLHIASKKLEKYLSVKKGI